MISRLQGVVQDSEPGRLVLDVGGVGYDVQVPESVLGKLGILGETITLHIRTLVREDDISLYGFSNRVQRHLFDLLRGVQGCGAKTSLALIGVLGEAKVRDSILGHDVKSLTLAPGVGPKLAEKIVAALRDRMGDVGLADLGFAVPTKAVVVEVDDELVQACMALGYPRARIEPHLDEVRLESQDIQSQIRGLLRRLAR